MSWPANPIPGDIKRSSRVVCGSLSLRERERARVRATNILVILGSADVSPSPRPSPAGRGGIVRRVAVLEGHARRGGEIPFLGGPCFVMARESKPWRATLRRGRNSGTRRSGSLHRRSNPTERVAPKPGASLLSGNSLHAGQKLPDFSAACQPGNLEAVKGSKVTGENTEHESPDCGRFAAGRRPPGRAALRTGAR